MLGWVPHYVFLALYIAVPIAVPTILYYNSKEGVGRFILKKGVVRMEDGGVAGLLFEPALGVLYKVHIYTLCFSPL